MKYLAPNLSFPEDIPMLCIDTNRVDGGGSILISDVPVCPTPGVIVYPSWAYNSLVGGTKFLRRMNIGTREAWV
jgi:hypothetical protein